MVDLAVTRFLNLAGEKHFIYQGINLVEVEEEVQLADVGEELVEA